MVASMTMAVDATVVIVVPMDAGDDAGFVADIVAVANCIRFVRYTITF